MLAASAHGSGGSARRGGGSPTVSACPQLADPRRAAGSSPCCWTWRGEDSGTRTAKGRGRCRRQRSLLPTVASQPGSPSPSTRRGLAPPGTLHIPTARKGFSPLCRGLGAAEPTPALAPAAQEPAMPLCRSHVCAEPCASLIPENVRFAQHLFFSKIKHCSEKNSNNFWL